MRKTQVRMDNFTGGAVSRRLAAGAVTTQPLLGNLGADVGKICSLRSSGKPFFFLANVLDVYLPQQDVRIPES